MSRKLLTALLTVLVLAAAPATAGAVTTIGEVAPESATLLECESGPYEVLQVEAAEGSWVVPGNGLITSWSTRAGSKANQVLVMKIYRPLGEKKYEVVGRDEQELTPGAVNTFPVKIAVQTGDLLGFSVPKNTAETKLVACATGPFPGYEISTSVGDGKVGGEFETTTPMKPETYKLNVAATYAPAPIVGNITPNTGSIAGGTEVTIIGSGLSEVTGVSFGGVPATSLQPISETEMTAVVPPGAKIGAVDVTVTAPGGTSPVTLATKFTYISAPAPTPPATIVNNILPAPIIVIGGPARETSGARCTVPKLVGKKLKAARTALGSADCALGKVTGKRGAKAKVVKQTPKQGTDLPAGSKVAVKLG